MTKVHVVNQDGTTAREIDEAPSTEITLMPGQRLTAILRIPCEVQRGPLLIETYYGKGSFAMVHFGTKQTGELFVAEVKITAYSVRDLNDLIDASYEACEVEKHPHVIASPEELKSMSRHAFAAADIRSVYTMETNVMLALVMAYAVKTVGELFKETPAEIESLMAEHNFDEAMINGTIAAIEKFFDENPVLGQWVQENKVRISLTTDISVIGLATKCNHALHRARINTVGNFFTAPSQQVWGILADVDDMSPSGINSQLAIALAFILSSGLPMAWPEGSVGSGWTLQLSGEDDADEPGGPNDDDQLREARRQQFLSTDLSDIDIIDATARMLLRKAGVNNMADVFGLTEAQLREILTNTTVRDDGSWVANQVDNVGRLAGWNGITWPQPANQVGKTAQITQEDADSLFGPGTERAFTGGSAPIVPLDPGDIDDSDLRSGDWSDWDESEREHFRSQLLSKLSFHTEAFGALEDGGIDTVGKLLDTSIGDVECILIAYPNSDSKFVDDTISQIQAFFKSYGIGWDEPTEDPSDR